MCAIVRHMRKTLAQRLVEKSTGQPIDALLRDLYVAKRHTDQEIADSLGVTRAVVQQWRSQLGITRDDRDPIPPMVAA